MKKIIIGNECNGDWAKQIINYLVKIAYPNHKIKWENENCNFIVSSHFGKKWNVEKKPYIYWSGEHTSISNLNKNHSEYIIIDTLITEKLNYYYIPFVCMSPYLLKSRLFTNRDRTFFIAYCSSSLYKHREDFFNLCIENYPKKPATDYIKSLGKCYGKYPESNNKIEGTWTSENLIREYSKFNFVLAMENNKKKGYVTEKIVNVFAAGAVPVFWGDDIVTQFFNKKAFINISDFDDFESCVKYIINLKTEEIHDMMDEPIFNWNNNRINEILEIDYDPPNQYYKNIANKLKEIIDKTLD